MWWYEGTFVCARFFRPIHVIMPGRLTAEEADVIARARIGTRASAAQPSKLSSSCVSASSASHYPAGLSATTLQLLGTIDALLKAPPPPARWALLRALSILEEHEELHRR